MPIDEARRWALFLGNRPALARFARKLVKDADDAQDLVQDLGLLVISHATGPSDEAHFRAWCRGMIRNIAAHYWRSTARRTDHAAPIGLAILELAGDESLADPEVTTHVRKQLLQLDTLDELSRELLRRRYVLGETSSEIARSLHRSPESIRMKLMRLRVTLRDSASDTEPGDGLTGLR